MKNNNQAKSSDFLSNLEYSARKILQRNNDIRTGKTDGKESISNESDALRKMNKSPFLSSPDLIQKRSGKSKCSDTKSSSVYRIRSALPRNNGWNYGKSASSKFDKDRENAQKLGLDSSALRKRFRCDLEIFDEEGNTSKEKHPIRILMTEHLISMTAKVDQMTRKRLSSLSSAVAKDQIESLEKSVVSMTTEASNLTRSEKDENSLNLYYENNASPADAQKRTGSGLDFKTKKSILKESDRAMPPVPPECWDFVVLESIDDETFLSISRIRALDSEYLEKDHYWIFNIRDTMYRSIERFVLLDDEMVLLVNSLHITGMKDGQPGQRFDESAVVHEQKITRAVDGMNLVGDYIVRNCRSGRKVEAILSIHLHHGFSPLSGDLVVPVYEIIAILNLYYHCKALDTRFWMSPGNGDIWEKLFDKIDLLIPDRKVR